MTVTPEVPCQVTRHKCRAAETPAVHTGVTGARTWYLLKLFQVDPPVFFADRFKKALITSHLNNEAGKKVRLRAQCVPFHAVVTAKKRHPEFECRLLTLANV